FRERLTIDFDIHPNALDAFVPRFLLQPLAENALHHGIEPMEAGGRLEIRVRVQHDAMTLELLDNGVRLSPVAKLAGMGLRNTRQRLADLYGDAALLEITSGPTGGTSVRVTLPFRREPDPLVSSDLEVRSVQSDVRVAQTAGGRS